VSAPVIIIGRHRRLGDIIRHADVEFVYFKSVTEFNRWRRRQDSRKPEDVATIVDELVAASRQSRRQLPKELDLALAWLRKQQRIPTLKQFAEVTCSRRSFFRKWRMSMKIAPSHFLQQLRKRYAQALLSTGHSVKEIARRVGVGSHAELQRLLTPT
jgi:transcriptional regulator GlxA family with amidase domain